MAKKDSSFIRLEKWQALELFSRVALKIEGTPLNSFLSDKSYSKNLHKIISNYQDNSEAQIIINKINTKNLSAKYKPHTLAGTLSTMADAVINFEPFTLPKDIYEMMRSFVNEGANPEQYLEFNTLTIYDDLPLVSVQQQEFENSRWWLYFSDRTLKFPQRNGVTKSFLWFKPFGRVEILHYSANTKKTEHYIGSFDKHPTDSRFLLLKMRLNGIKEKYLRMTFFTGGNHLAQIDLLLGQFNNIGKSIYSGSVLMHPAPKYMNVTRAEKKVGFYVEKLHKRKLKSYIWDYFRIRLQNVMRTTDKVSSLAEFKTWHPTKEATRAMIFHNLY